MLCTKTADKVPDLMDQHTLGKKNSKVQVSTVNWKKVNDLLGGPMTQKQMKEIEEEKRSNL